MYKITNEIKNMVEKSIDKTYFCKNILEILLQGDLHRHFLLNFGN